VKGPRPSRRCCLGQGGVGHGRAAIQLHHVFALLLENNAAVDAANRTGMTPLQVAAQNGRKEVVGLLNARRAEAKAKDSIQKAILLRKAVEDGDLRQVKTLLLFNPDLVFSKGSLGETCLHWAVRTGRTDMVALLLANGAAVNAEDDAGFTPSHLAVGGGYKNVWELLRQHGGSDNIGLIKRW